MIAHIATQYTPLMIAYMHGIEFELEECFEGVPIEIWLSDEQSQPQPSQLPPLISAVHNGGPEYSQHLVEVTSKSVVSSRPLTSRWIGSVIRTPWLQHVIVWDS